VSGLGDRLETLRAPGEEAARERAWDVVAAAFAEREPVVPSRHRGRVAIVALAAVLALATVGVAGTSAGRSLVTEIRRAIGVERAQPALFSLPAPGRLLVVSGSGAWVAQQDGSKRLLGRYRDATWSPNGLFVAGTRPDELAALEPDGDVRWTLARPGLRFARWTGSRTDTRIAYADRSGIRVVAGDGSGDRLLAPGESGPLAWRPGTLQMAYVSASEVRMQDAATGRVVWRANRGPADAVIAVEWSGDGRRLLVLTEHAVRVYDARGRLVAHDGAASGRYAAAAFRPHGQDVAVAREQGGQSRVFRLRDGRILFSGTGALGDLTWSPDGRWLAVAWPEADQLVLLQPGVDRRIRAVGGLSRQFRSRTFPRLTGWR
jgi:hypothetical protein